MKLYLIPVLVLSLAAATFAEEKVTLTGVHNCCKKCTDGINKAVATAPGVTATVEKTTVTLTAANSADVQKAVDALNAAGYTGKSDSADVKVAPPAGPDSQVTSLTVSGTHVCCGKCVKAIQAALKTVPGVKSDTVTKGTDTFKVEGDFNGKAVMEALAAAGFTGTAK